GAQRRDDGARARSGADRELELPLLTRLLDLFEPRDPALHLADLLGLLLARLRRGLALDLVVVRRLAHGVADAQARPLPLRPRAGDQVGLLVRELVVLLPLVPADGLPLLQIRVVTSAEHAVA